VSDGGGGDRPGATGMAGRHSAPGTRDELAPGVLMRALGVGVAKEAAAAGEHADPARSAARARLAVAAVSVGTTLLAGVLGPGAGAGAGAGQNSLESRSNVPAVAGAAGSVGSQGDSFVNTRKFGSDVVLGAAAAAAVSMSALAGDAMQWRVADGGNGHWYATTSVSMTWPALRDWCAARGGHLATINNAQEWMWVKQNLPAIEKFVGAYQDHSDPSYSEPNGGWKWVTGEPFLMNSYSSMDDCPGGLEGSCGCVGDGNQDVLFYTGCCNNQLDDVGDGIVGGCDSTSRPGVIEFDADCNSDGIVDYGQILAGTLADINANGIPDSCECAANPGLPACCIGDIVADRVVNGADLGTLLAYWGTRTSGAFSIASDLNNDGRIDGSDLGILLAYWGACQTSNVPAWATLLETQPDPAVVTDAALRAAIAATGLPWRVRDTGTGIEMLLAPPGTFEMGCSQRSTAYDCYSSELPVHQVNLMNAFYIGRYEVTQAQWFAKMGSNPSQFQGATDAATRPVEKVSWTAIQSYLTSTNMRLPTEAEWEFACRAGTNTPFYNGSSDDSTIGALAWYNDNSGGQTHSVGGKAPNALGLHDMLGNVWEWVNDWYGSYSTSTETDPAGPTSGTLRCIRGGAWFDPDTRYLRSSSRGGFSPQFFDTNIGFRVARNP